jgi:hypothetical protein
MGTIQHLTPNTLAIQDVIRFGDDDADIGIARSLTVSLHKKGTAFVYTNEGAKCICVKLSADQIAALLYALSTTEVQA